MKRFAHIALITAAGLVPAASLVTTGRTQPAQPEQSDACSIAMELCRPFAFFERDFGDILRARVGLEIAPVPLDLQNKSANLVGLGSYLVNVQGGCGGCHTHPAYESGGSPYLGQPAKVNIAQYLTGGRQFGPVIVSSNLTPDAAGKPAGLTFTQFRSVMTTGKTDPSGHVMQVMPWPEYASLTDLDLRAIYEYLRAIPPLPNNPNPGP